MIISLLRKNKMESIHHRKYVTEYGLSTNGYATDAGTSTAYARPYFEAFLIALFITLLPSRMLAYVAPFITLFWFIVRSGSGKTLYRTILFFISFCTLLVFYYYLYSLDGVRFLVGNSFVALCTYGSIILALLLPGQKLVNQHFTYSRYAAILKYVLLIEGLTGILQFMIVSLTGRFDMLSGDAVQGTIGLLVFMTDNPGFGNQMFAINMAFFLMLFMPYVLARKKDYYVVVIGLFSLMLAGVLHVFIGLMVSVVFTVLFFRRNILFGDLPKTVLFTTIAVLLLLSFELIFPGISKSANAFFKQYQGGKSPKIAAVNTAFYQLPERYPLVYAIGLGPGQYSSRAGLMSSGDYFDTKVAFLPNEVSQPFKEYVSSLWKAYGSDEEGYGNSTMHRPFFSLLSVFAEFGLIGFGLLVGIIGYFFFRLRNLFFFYKGKDPTNYYLCFCLAVLLITLLSISFFENYLETTQAILPGLLLFKVFYSQLLTEQQAMRPEASVSPRRELVFGKK